MALQKPKKNRWTKEEELAAHVAEKKAIYREAKKELREEQKIKTGSAVGDFKHEVLTKHANERRKELLEKAKGTVDTKKLMQELTIKLLSDSGQEIINTILRKAKNDDDKDQAQMLKMCIDRIAPMAVFDTSKQSENSKGITINITGLGQANVETTKDVGEVIDHE